MEQSQFHRGKKNLSQIYVEHWMDLWKISKVCVTKFEEITRNRIQVPSLYILSLILTWLSSSSNHRASRWVSDDPTMPCTRSPISRCSLQARRSRFSKLLSLLRSEQNLKVFLITVRWNNFKQYSKLNYQILNFASS